MLESGEAVALQPADYPEPLRRFLLRERTMVHVKLTLAAKRRLEARSRRLGIPVDDLARKWIEQRLKRNTG